MNYMDRYSALLAAHHGYLYRLELNTFVAESIGMVYMDTPKTAGTSIKTRLAQIEANYVAPRDSLSLETVPEMFIHDRNLNPLKPVTAYPEKQQCEMLFSAGWKRFCVVRNPYSRLFSAWFSKVLLRQPGFSEVLAGYVIPDRMNESSEIYKLFDRFVLYLSQHGCDSDPHWDLQTRLLFHGDIEWGKVFRFETLSQDLAENQTFFDGKSMELGKLNVSGFSPDWDLVSKDTVSLIQHIYRADFDVYKYPEAPPSTADSGDTLAEYVNAVVGRNKRIEALIETCDDLRLRLQESLHREGRLSDDLSDLVNSRSWKLTSPLRKLFNCFRAH